MTLSLWSIDLKSTAFFQQGNNLKLASLISVHLLLKDLKKKSVTPKQSKQNKQAEEQWCKPGQSWAFHSVQIPAHPRRWILRKLPLPALFCFGFFFPVFLYGWGPYRVSIKHLLTEIWRMYLLEVLLKGPCWYMWYWASIKNALLLVWTLKECRRTQFITN